MAGYAMKDVLNLTLTPLDGTGEEIVIDYLNGASISWDEESIAAKKKGADTIFFGSPKTGEMSIDAEIIDDKFIALMTGGVESSGVIEIGAMSPSTMYTGKGIFAVVNEDGSTTNKEITIHSCKPRANGELSFSAEDIATFSITFDLMSKDEKFLTIKDATATMAAKAK